MSDPKILSSDDLQEFVFGKDTAKNKLTNWKNEPRVEDLNYDIKQANSSHAVITSRVREWDKLLYAETDKTKIIKGRSGITPKVVRKLAEWRYANLAKAFLREAKLFSVTAVSAAHMNASIQNELVLNFQFNSLIDKVKFINDMVRAVVNEGTAVIRIGWETKTKIVEKEEEIYQYIQPDLNQAAEITAILEQIGIETQQGQLESSHEAPTFIQLPPEMQETIIASTEYGAPVVALPTGETQTVKEEVVIKNRPAIEVIPIHNLIIDPSCLGDFSKARFAVYSYTTSYAELKANEEIYTNLDELNSEIESISAQDILNMDDTQFNRLNVAEASNFQFKDKARKRIQAYEYWGYYDIEGTGVLQAIVATIVNNKIIRLERSPFPDNELPFVVIPYMPVKGSVYGEPDAELLKDNQEIIQALVRGIIDIQARGANGQIAMPKGFLDTINTKRFNNGEDYNYEYNGQHPSQAIYMHTSNEIPQSIMMLLQQQYAEAESNVGVRAFQGGLDGSAYGQVVQGMGQSVTALTVREDDIIQRIAKGLEKIGNKILAMNSIWLQDTETVAITQTEFVEINREELSGEFVLNVKVKSSAEAEGKAQQLTFVAQTLGGEADWGLRKIMLLEICKLYGLDSALTALQQYDPQPAQPTPEEQQLTQLEIQKKQAEIDKLTAEAEYYRSRGNFVEAQVGDVQAGADQKNLDFLEQQEGIKHNRQKEIVEAQAKAQNEGKLATEILKGNNAIRSSIERNNGTVAKSLIDRDTKQTIEANRSGSSNRYKARVDKTTGRTYIPNPSLRGRSNRNTFSLKTPKAEPSIPTAEDLL